MIKANDKISTFDEFEESFEREVVDYNNPKCIECNDCCTMGASITDKEYKRLKMYLNNDINGKVIYERSVKLIKSHAEKGVIYFKCPFSNSNRRCSVYWLRPNVCKSFHCKPELNTLDKEIDPVEYKYTIGHLFVDMRGITNE